MGKKWNNEDDIFLQKNYAVMGGTYCSNYLDRTIGAIWARCRDRGIKMTKDDHTRHINNAHDLTRKYQINRSLFEKVDSPIIAYLLGLLWADGSIRSSKDSTRISITLKKEDALEIVPLFEYTGHWSIQEIQYKCHKNPVITILCYNRKLYDLLYSLDFFDKSRVSACKVLNHIPRNLRHYWWRGYFDGDGGLYVSYEKSKYSIEITSSYEQDWTFGDSLLEYNISFKIIKKNSKEKNTCSRLCIRRKQNIANFLNYIYQDDVFGLSRKYKKSRDFLDKFIL